MGELICDTCNAKLKYVREPLCKKCGKALTKDDEFCYDCMKKEYSYVQGRAVFFYDDLMKKSISMFKYKARVEYADFYVDRIIDRLGDCIDKWGIDVIVPVPIHKNKLRKRGFNQAQILAKRLGKKLNIGVLSDILIRIEDTVPQKGLDNVKRRKNLINAITINNKLNIPDCINNILLIDDIYTTGATINSCSKNLKLINEEYNIFFISVAIGYGL